MRSWYRRSAVILLGSAVSFVACDRTPETPTTAAPGAEARANRVTDEPRVTEERADEIWNSPEVQHMLALQQEFVTRVEAAATRGVELEALRAATHAAVSGDDSRLAALLFDSREEADRYVASLKEARAAIPRTFPEVAEAMVSMDTAKCTAKGGSVDAFFNNFDKVRESPMYPTDGRNAPPDCRLLALACAGHCSVNAPGLATVACFWQCWCAFCGGLSGFATILCDA